MAFSYPLQALLLRAHPVELSSFSQKSCQRLWVRFEQRRGSGSNPALGSGQCQIRALRAALHLNRSACGHFCHCIDPFDRGNAAVSTLEADMDEAVSRGLRAAG
jgi:hypothetical protein